MQAVANLEGYEYRRIAWEQLNGYYVSTVLLGVNHQLDEGGPPLIFETLPFVDEFKEVELDLPAFPEAGLKAHRSRHVIKPSLDHLMRRYETKAQALRGHAEVCEELRTMIRQTLQVTER